YSSSPIARFSLAGVPVITIAGILTGAFLVFNLVKWASDAIYGVNNQQSALYMLEMYVLAVVIYLAARVVRGRQGIDLARIHAEIPMDSGSGRRGWGAYGQAARTHHPGGAAHHRGG